MHTPSDHLRAQLDRTSSLLITPEIRQLTPHLGKEIAQYDELWHLWRAACASSLYFTSKVVLCDLPPKENLISPTFHGPMCRLLEDDDVLDLLLEYPRKSLKSQMGTIYMPVHKLMKLAVAKVDLYHRCFIVCHTLEGVADRKWWAIKEIIERNEMVRFLFPEFKPSKRWNTEYGWLEAKNPRPDPNFEPLAKRWAGKHCDTAVADDLIDELNYRNEEAVGNARESYRLIRNLLESGESRRICVGNRWGLNDLNSDIHRTAGETGTVIISVDAEEGPILRGEWCCKNLPDYAKEMLDYMRVPPWGERFSKKFLQVEKKRVGPRVFSAQFKNKPEDPDAAEFDFKLVKRSKLVNTPHGPAIQLADEKHAIPLSECNVYINWDPALDGPHSEAENAVIVTAVTPPLANHRDGARVVLREHARMESPYKSMEKFMAYVRAFQPWLHSTGVEEVLFQRILKTNLMDHAKFRRVFLGIRKIRTHTGQSKEQKIRQNVGYVIESGSLYVDESCPKMLDQIRVFGVPGALRDLVDALAQAAQLWKTATSKEELDEDEAWEQESQMEAGITGYGSALRM